VRPEEQEHLRALIFALDKLSPAGRKRVVEAINKIFQ
jgi:hypothetical protein